MKPIVLARPKWLWDSRAPFHNFVAGHKQMNRIFASTTLAMEASSYYVRMPSNQDRKVRQVLHVDKGTARALRAWASYDISCRMPGETRNARHSPELFLNAMAEGEAFLQTSTIVLYATHFEHFVLCWALNTLLAMLEARVSVTSSQQSLGDAFARDHKSLDPMQG